MALFRVIRIADNQEIQRYLALEDACVQWVKDPRGLRVEELPTGSATEVREVAADECCAALHRWLPTTRTLRSEDERRDMEQLIREACDNIAR